MRSIKQVAQKFAVQCLDYPPEPAVPWQSVYDRIAAYVTVRAKRSVLTLSANSYPSRTTNERQVHCVSRRSLSVHHKIERHAFLLDNIQRRTEFIVNITGRH